MEEFYNMKKQSYLLRAKKIREKFNEFYLKALVVNQKGLELYEIAQKNPKLLEDFIQMCESNEDVIFNVRLMCAVMYIQDPNNKEVVQKLLDDIELNSNSKSK